MRFLKSHGLGNDYLLLAEGPAPGPDQVVALCDRSTGLGADGVLIPTSSSVADHGVRIMNPDGSEAEISGNGIRILARWLRRHRGAPPSFTVEAGGRVLACQVTDHSVTVAMGPASFSPAEVPVLHSGVEAVEIPVKLDDGSTVTVTAVGMGNPHCVVFVEDLGGLPWRRLGALLERHSIFPRRTNVQFAQVLDSERVAVRIWERGAGETRASGSSACAVAAAGHRTGRLGRDVEVIAPGGVLRVIIGEGWEVSLSGPVEEVAWMEPSPDLLERLAHVGHAPC